MEIDEAWSHIPVSAIRYPYMAFKYRKLLRKLAVRGLARFDMGKTDIAILGRSAVGKSVLSDRLSGRPGDLKWTVPSLSRRVETMAMDVGDDALITRTLPGQESKERDQGLHEALSKHADLKGIIYVADWGYTNIRDAAVRQDLIARQGIDTIDKLRAMQLEAEKRDFARVMERVRESKARNGTPLWVIVAVNKCDLFMDKLDEAQAYYHPAMRSDFSEIYKDTLKHVGSQNMMCEAVPLSAWNEDFEWNGNISPARLNESQARALFRNFYGKIDALTYPKAERKPANG